MNNDVKYAFDLFSNLDADERKVILVLLRELASNQESSACSDQKEKNTVD